jgi:hypothetical protein
MVWASSVKEEEDTRSRHQVEVEELASEEERETYTRSGATLKPSRVKKPRQARLKLAQFHAFFFSTASTSTFVEKPSAMDLNRVPIAGYYTVLSNVEVGACGCRVRHYRRNAPSKSA